MIVTFVAQRHAHNMNSVLMKNAFNRINIALPMERLVQKD